MLIPSDRSGNPAGERLGRSEPCGRSIGGDFDLDVLRLPTVVGESRRACPIRNNSDGVSSPVVAFNRFTFEGCGPSSAALTGVDASEPTDWCGEESLRFRC